MVFPYVENHNFYVEHWAHSVIWRKMRDLGKIFVDAGFIGDVEDVFMLKKYEVADAIYDLYSGWAVGAPSAGPGHWPGIVESRRKTLDALKTWDCPPALGIPPEVVTEPFTVMLWGITSDSVASWLNAGDESGDGSLSGFAASPGLVEGPARVISSADEIADLQDGEILVAPLTAPSWAPVFGKGRTRRRCRTCPTGSCRQSSLRRTTWSGCTGSTSTSSVRLKASRPPSRSRRST